MRRAWAILAAVMTLLAGCTTPDDAAGGSDPPVSEAEDPTPSAPSGSPRIADRQHAHDYWEGETSVILLEESVPVMIAHNHLFDEPPREQHTHGCDETLASKSQGGSRKFSLPEGRIVLPGTERIEILATWSTPTITGLRFLYRPANAHDLVDGGLVESSAITTITLAQGMADAGHATRTNWVFFLCADGARPIDTAEGSVHVNMMALRAEKIPLDPPHPDHWRGATTLELANVTTTTHAITVLNKGDGAWIHVPLEHGAIVPPETRRIVVHVALHDASPTARSLPSVPMLYYRDSSVPEWEFRVANATRSGEAHEFEFEVDHNTVDGVYAHESNWAFWLRIAAPDTVATAAGRMSAPRSFDGSLSVHILAERMVAEASE